MKKTTYRYDVRQIDAWNEGDDVWTWNESWRMANWETSANDVKRAFLRMLRKIGIVYNPHVIYVADDGEVIELRRRGTHEPLIAAVPMF